MPKGRRDNGDARHAHHGVGEQRGVVLLDAAGELLALSDELFEDAGEEDRPDPVHITDLERGGV